MLFLFDENIPHSLSEALKILENSNKRSPINVKIQHVIDFMGKKGYPDEDIIKAASKKHAIIITHDSDFKRIKNYKPLLLEHKVGYVYFRTPKTTYHYWDIVKAFVNVWEDLKKDIAKDSAPFVYEVSKQGKHSKLDIYG
jgi:hypothetical protein